MMDVYKILLRGTKAIDVFRRMVTKLLLTCRLTQSFQTAVSIQTSTSVWGLVSERATVSAISLVHWPKHVGCFFFLFLDLRLL